MKYFAYGSNMLEQRLKASNRIPDASFSAVATLSGHKLCFNKKSIDGSGKGNIVRSDSCDSIVYGVVFDVPDSQLSALDRAEGPGYRRESVTIRLLNGEQIQALVYVADVAATEDSRVPYSWYKNIVLAGAAQHNLPRDYVATIMAVGTSEDSEIKRGTKLEAEEALKKFHETKA